METDLTKLIADYAFAAVFLGLYIKAQVELIKVYREIAEQRRDENREMRNLLFELARQGGVTPVRNARVYDTDDRPITESRRPPGFPHDQTPLPMP